MSGCKHLIFEAIVDVNRLYDDESEVNTVEPDHYNADVKIKCCDCGMDFRFLGLLPGVNLNGATVSVDQLEARLAIKPVKEKEKIC